MSIPSTPSFGKVPDTVNELVKGYRIYNRGLKASIADIKKTTDFVRKEVADNIKLTKELKEATKQTKQVADAAKTVTDNMKGGKFSKVNKNLGGAVLFGLAAGAVGIGLANIWASGELNETNIAQYERIGNEFGQQLKLIEKNQLALRRLEQKIDGVSEGLDVANGYASDTRQYANRAEAKADTAQQQVLRVVEIAIPAINNAIANLVKQSADNDNILFKGLQEVRAKIQNTFGGTSSPNLSGVFSRIRKLESDTKASISEVKVEAQVTSIKIQKIDTRVEKLEKTPLVQSNQNADAIKKIQSSNDLQNKVIGVLQKSIDNIGNGLNNLISQVEKIRTDFPKQSEAIAMKIVDGKIEKISTEVKNLNVEVTQKLNKGQLVREVEINKGPIIRILEPAIEKQIEDKTNPLNYALPPITGGLSALGSELDRLRRELDLLKNRNNFEFNNLRSKPQVDPEANKKLDELLKKVDLLPPAVVARAVQDLPKPLSGPQIEASVGNAVCRSLNGGGCMGKANQDLTNSINSNTNQKAGNLLDAYNAGSNTAQMAALTRIDSKLGPQLANGGLAGYLQKTTQWMMTDRILNVLTWANTMHNAYMLSSGLGETLFSVIDNIGTLFFKNVDGVEVNSRSIIGNTVDGFAKQLFGVETWNGIKTTWKKWNRIYQAGANIINSMRSMWDSARSIAEWSAENTGKIGNALKRFGVVGEKAYSWMPEQVNAQSVWMQRLENLQEAASGIEMVTGELVSIQDNLNELKTQREEFDKGIKDLAPKERPDNEPTKSKHATTKTASSGPAISDNDKEADD